MFQIQFQQLEQSKIVGFSPLFAILLLKKLKEMKENHKIFAGEFNELDEGQLTDDAVPVVFYLADQIKFGSDYFRNDKVCDEKLVLGGEIDSLIKTAENFLRIFEVVGQDKTLAELGYELSVRGRYCLKKMNITSLSDLVTMREADLLAYKSMTPMLLDEYNRLLQRHGWPPLRKTDKRTPPEV